MLQTVVGFDLCDFLFFNGFVSIEEQEQNWESCGRKNAGEKEKKNLTEERKY